MNRKCATEFNDSPGGWWSTVGLGRVPAGRERAAALRLLCLDRAAARFELFSDDEQDWVVGIDPRDHGNRDTRLEPCRRPAPNLLETWQRITSLPGAERPE
jgi:hypothetical protein